MESDSFTNCMEYKTKFCGPIPGMGTIKFVATIALFDDSTQTNEKIDSYIWEEMGCRILAKIEDMEREYRQRDRLACGSRRVQGVFAPRDSAS